MKERNQEQQDAEGATFIQKRLKGILARKKIEEMRQEEMVFLGMARKQKTKEEMAKDPILIAKTTEKKRQVLRGQKMELYETGKDSMKSDIVDDEKEDIIH